EQDVRLVQDGALDHNVALAFALQHEVREHEMGSGGSDVDAHAGELDVVIADDVAINGAEAQFRRRRGSLDQTNGRRSAPYGRSASLPRTTAALMLSTC